MPKKSREQQLGPIPILQILVSDLRFADLPREWKAKNISHFSTHKRLYNYQIEALENAVKALFLFYQGQRGNKPFSKPQDGELPSIDYEEYVEKRKAEFYDSIVSQLEVLGRKEVSKLLWIEDRKGAFEHLQQIYGSTKVKRQRRIVEIIDPRCFANRMGFWMATGSGKTLVLIKLIEILDVLIQGGAIPTRNTGDHDQDYNFLVLSHREDLLDQFRQHINEFNEGRFRKIRIWNLKEYEDVKARRKGEVKNSSINVFIYRSDLIDDQTKENRLSYKDIEAHGDWFIFLDEAHKGTKEDSKRQHYYSILSRNGFLFNFSATFVDAWDIVSTVFNFNLKEFVSRGYGKNILLPHCDFVKFSKNEESVDFSRQEKQQMILESLIILGLLVKAEKNIVNLASKGLGRVYHKPLLVVYGREVNTDQADVKLFFEYVSDVFRGKIKKSLFFKAKNSLAELFSNRENRQFIFGQGVLRINTGEIMEYTYQELLEHVFHTKSPGRAEIIRNPWNSKELAIKINTADQPFALLKIGDISSWLRTNLSGYQLFESFEDRGFFTQLNEPNSPITILMGSHAFYEGWDSNRPNIILFVNIGVGSAHKFVIQAIGRGVRINPFGTYRKRLSHLALVDEQARDLARSLSPQSVSMIETLFIFGSNRANLATILDSINYINTITSRKTTELETRKKRHSLNNPATKIRDSKTKTGTHMRKKQECVVSRSLQNFITWLGKTKEERVLKIYVLLQAQLGQTHPVQICEIEKMIDVIEYSKASVSNEIQNPLEELVLIYERVLE